MTDKNLEYLGFIAGSLNLFSFIYILYENVVHKNYEPPAIILIITLIGYAFWIYYGIKVKSISTIVISSIFLVFYIAILIYLLIKRK